MADTKTCQKCGGYGYTVTMPPVAPDFDRYRQLACSSCDGWGVQGGPRHYCAPIRGPYWKPRWRAWVKGHG